MTATRIVPALLLVLAALAWGSGPAAAQAPGDDLLQGFQEAKPPGASPGEGGDLLGGFEELKPLTAEPTAAEPTAPSLWALNGFARLDGAYNYAHEAPPPGETDWRGLSKLRATLQLELSVDLPARWRAFVSGQASHDFVYELNGRDEYTDEVLERNEQEAEFRDVYLAGALLPRLDLKVGRQIVVWGLSDYIRVVDVLNPLDQREPGLADIEDLRLPVTMTRLDYYPEAWNLTAVAVHEIRFNKDPAFGSDFFPSPQPLPREEVPADGGDNTEWGFAAKGIFSGWDLGFYWARYFDDRAHLAAQPAGPPRLEHSRLTLGGAAVNVALGNWLLRSEAALVQGLRFFHGGGDTWRRVDALVGFEYSGITDATLGLEVADQHLLDYDPRLRQPPDIALEDVFQVAASYRQDFMHQTLQLQALALLFGERGQRGSLQRVSATYDLRDAVSVSGGVIVYQPGGDLNPLLQNAKDNDRVFFETRVDF